MNNADFVPATTLIEVVRKDTASIVLPVLTDANLDADLTGFTAKAVIERSGEPDVAATVSINGSSISVGITSAQTEALKDDSHITVSLTNADGTVVRTVLCGRIFFKPRNA
jgi:hypothetical protein